MHPGGRARSGCRGPARAPARAWPGPPRASRRRAPRRRRRRPHARGPARPRRARARATRLPRRAPALPAAGPRARRPRVRARLPGASAMRARSSRPWSIAGGGSRSRSSSDSAASRRSSRRSRPAAQPVQRGRRSLAAAGRLGQRILGAGALGQIASSASSALRFCAAKPARRASADSICAGQRADVERRDPGAEAGDLDPELLRTLGGRRLQGQRTEPLRHLRLDVARALDLDCDPRELQLGAMAAALELPEAGRLLDERPALLRLRGEDRLHASLRDDRAHRRAEPDVGEQLDDVGAANVRAVDEVLPLAASVQATDDRDLGVVELGQRPVRVVEEELDLAMVGLRPVRRSGEENVVRLLGAHFARRERAGRPDQRVRDVRLARAVRPDDDARRRARAGPRPGRETT